MTALWLFALPPLAGIVLMAVIITAETWIGGRKWKP